MSSLFKGNLIRKLLNTLYITNPEVYLARDGETVAVRIGAKVKLLKSKYLLTSPSP